MGMKIVQNAAVRLAQDYDLAFKVAALEDPSLFTMIQRRDEGSEVVKCITGKKGCAIITVSNEASRSVEDCLRVWEGYENFIDLGAEVLDTGRIVRDFLILDEGFIRGRMERLRGFDEEIQVEYGLGVVTLIGDRMRDSPGIASIAIGSLPKINIKRAVFAPHTSQIILVIEEARVEEAVKAIHSKIDEMNERRP
jgi:aspartokinase